jgi:hypothetical protein
MQRMLPVTVQLLHGSHVFVHSVDVVAALAVVSTMCNTRNIHALATSFSLHKHSTSSSISMYTPT